MAGTGGASSCAPSRRTGVWAHLTPCNLIYGAIAIATAAATVSSAVAWLA